MPLPIDGLSATLGFGLGSVLASGLTWLLFRRRLPHARDKLLSLGSAHVNTEALLMHARRQVEALNKELEVLRRARPPQAGTRPAAMAHVTAPALVVPAAPLRPAAAEPADPFPATVQGGLDDWFLPVAAGLGRR